MITATRLRKLLRYNKRTGEFRWRVDHSAKARKGALAGSRNSAGYVLIGINGKLYLAHRLAFLYVRGYWPSGWLDHRNRIRHHNVWNNLREATRSQNLRNTGARRKNQTREKNVTKRRGKFCVILRVAGRNKRLGAFNELRNAVAVRDAWTEFYGLNF